MEVKMINNRPVKIWTDHVEESAMRQIENLTTLPFLFHHLAIMPDVHAGMGMPIGGVLACTDAVIPNAVGIKGCEYYADPVRFSYYADAAANTGLLKPALWQAHCTDPVKADPFSVLSGLLSGKK